MKEMELIKVFKALSDPTRLKLVLFLSKSYEEPYFMLIEESGLSQPTMSHHLSKLLEAELVIKDKRGIYTYYQINKNMLRKVGLDIKKHAKNVSFLSL